MRISARNQLRGTIVDVVKGATTSHVRIDIGERRRHHDRVDHQRSRGRPQTCQGPTCNCRRQGNRRSRRCRELTDVITTKQDSSHGACGSVRYRTDLAWVARDRSSSPYRALLSSCALRSGLGASHCQTHHATAITSRSAFCTADAARKRCLTTRTHRPCTGAGALAPDCGLL